MSLKQNNMGGNYRGDTSVRSIDNDNVRGDTSVRLNLQQRNDGRHPYRVRVLSLLIVLGVAAIGYSLYSQYWLPYQGEAALEELDAERIKDISALDIAVSAALASLPAPVATTTEVAATSTLSSSTTAKFAKIAKSKGTTTEPVATSTGPLAQASSTQYVYISIPSTSPTCADLDLPTLAEGWAYHCVDTANYTRADGRGWLPIDLTHQGISTLPVDPINAASALNYYSFLQNDEDKAPYIYEISATLGSALFLHKNSSNDEGIDPIRYEKGSRQLMARREGLKFSLDTDDDQQIGARCDKPSCLTFAGIGDNLSFTSPHDFSTHKEGSYSLWFKFDTIPTSALTILNPGTLRLDLNIEQETGKLFLWFTDSSDTPVLIYKTQGSTFVGSGFHSAVVSKSKEAISFYLDGIKVAIYPTVLTTLSTQSQLQIAYGTPSQNDIGMNLRRLRVYSIPLTDEEVKLIFQAGL